MTIPYKNKQLGLLIAISATFSVISVKHLYKSPEPFAEWSFYLGVIILLTICSIGLMIKHRFNQIESQIIKDNLKYGRESADNLKTNIEYEPWKDDR